MSRGIPTEVVKAAENFSQFSRQSGMESARVVYSYRTVRCGDGVRHVLSCIRDAGADYSGRTNHLAQHLVFDDREAASCASSGFTPAGVILGTEWPSHDGYCGWIESAPQWASSAPEPTWPWWAHYSSSPECRIGVGGSPSQPVTSLTTSFPILSGSVFPRTRLYFQGWKLREAGNGSP